MKLTIVTLFLFIGSVFASPVFPQMARVNIAKQNVPTRSVLNEIEKQTDYLFVNNANIDLNKKVSVKAVNKTVDEVLSTLFEGTDVVYAMEGSNIMLMKKEASKVKRSDEVKSVQQQRDRKVTGIIKDSKGEPLIGANVVVKGTTNGTITDMDGKFSISAPSGSTLQFSYIGYLTQNVAVGSQQNLSIVLVEDSKTLSEVVVTALGIKREEKALGYSVQKVSGSDLQVVKGTDVSSSLTGKISGLSVSNSSEISEKPTLALRGETPLVVIDGVAYGNMTLSDLSAEDIESIDVLKGATASALYGVRGRGGAIMITTKKSGKKGSLTVNVSNNTMFSAGYLKMPKAQSSYSTGNYGQLEYNSGYVWGDYMDGHEVEQYDPETMTVKSMPLLSKGKNNLSNFLRSSLLTNTNVNISQSSELGGFRVSATQIHQLGEYPNTKLDKYMINGGGNITYNKFKLDASFSYRKDKAPNMPKVNYGNGNIFYNMLVWGGTEYDIRDFKNYWKIKDQKENWPFEAWYDNPWYIVNERIDKQDNDLFNTNATLTYDIMKDLSVMYRTGYDTFTNTEERRQSVGDSGQRRGYYEYAQYIGSSFNNDLIVNGNYKIKDFGINGIAGLSSYWYKNTDFDSYTRGGLSVPGFYSLNASVERPGVSKTIKEKVLYSVYGKLGFSWKDAAYLDVTGRNDWSSTLPSSSRSYFYPSVSGSILPTAFYNPFENVLDFWKLRASWTIAKKDLDVYETNRVYNVTTDVWDGLSTATYPTSLRDPNVKPETERSYEFGTDFRFFNNRLGFDYTYFTRLRYDRLISAPISLSSGSEYITTNTDEELKQKGMEFSVNGKPIVTKDFQWEATFNASYWHWYYNKLDPVYSSQDPRKAKGERYDKFFMTDWVHDNDGNIVHQAGLPVKNNFQTVMGYKDPKVYLGFTSRLTYKNLSLNVSLDGRIGGLMYSWTEQAMWQSGAHPDSDNKWRYDEVVNHKLNYIGKGSKVVSGTATFDPYGKVLSDNRVFAPNDVAVSYQSYTTVYNENPWDHQARQNIKDASFIKLREIALNYTLPTEWAHKLLMKNAVVGFVAQNLLMWTKAFKFSDPDRGLENLNSPTARYLGFNINLTL
jgi:TonB-linked SusC/RagA family outer membrane protein